MSTNNHVNRSGALVLIVQLGAEHVSVKFINLSFQTLNICYMSFYFNEYFRFTKLC
jgi:hypothetical protein